MQDAAQGLRKSRTRLYRFAVNNPVRHSLTHSLTLAHSMDHSPSWKGNRFSASQEIPRIVWKPKVHYRTHKFPPPVPILSQLDSVHTPTSHFLKTHLNITLSSTPGSPNWSLSFTFPHKNPVHASPLPHTRYMPHPSHSSRFYHRNNVGEQYRSLSSSVCSFLHPPVTSSPLGPNILLNTLPLKHPQPTQPCS